MLGGVFNTVLVYNTVLGGVLVQYLVVCLVLCLACLLRLSVIALGGFTCFALQPNFRQIVYVGTGRSANSVETNALVWIPISSAF